MNKQILVPDIGDFENVEVIEVLVKQGEDVRINDPLITLESDKSSVEVPSTEEGKIEKLNVKVGDRVSKGDLILSIISRNEELKSKIPPVTEKIIEEAEKSLQKEKIIEKNINEAKPKDHDKKNKIIISDNNDTDPLETKEWIDSLNAVK